MVRKLSNAQPGRIDPNTGPYDPPEQAYGAFAVPPLEAGGPGNNPMGWAPPVYQRPGNQPMPDYRTNPTLPPQATWRPRDADKAQRSAVETQDADGWTESKGINPGDRRWAENPRLNVPEEPRLTSKMSPSRYSFTRPFDQFNRNYPDALVGTSRQFNGQHFSMADHRRDYPILGMEPAKKSMRSTYRLMPPPWGDNLVDLPPLQTPLASAHVRPVDVPRTGRSYRLG